MADRQLSIEDIEYVADMLRAIAWVKDDLGPVSSEALRDLEISLGAAESALRRVAAEMELHVEKKSQSN
ncbi:MAG: hypothetical protein NXH72_15910 [Hyphomonadaceae bacterium]|nr:hypothetical protein [Hyphomonadaceae bacterium]